MDEEEAEDPMAEDKPLVKRHCGRYGHSPELVSKAGMRDGVMTGSP